MCSIPELRYEHGIHILMVTKYLLLIRTLNLQTCPNSNPKLPALGPCDPTFRCKTHCIQPPRESRDYSMHLKVRELLLRLESTIEICLVVVDSIIKDNRNCNRFKV